MEPILDFEKEISGTILHDQPNLITYYRIVKEKCSGDYICRKMYQRKNNNMWGITHGRRWVTLSNKYVNKLIDLAREKVNGFELIG